ncbi:MAG: restriction endonuclease subunit S [Clostridia bacterium]|nr:restriction endonuclease subunit S [Clostridia bacterium]
MEVRLGEIFQIGSGGTPSKTHPEYYEGNIPWIKTGDLREQYLYKSDEYITEEGLHNSSARIYEPNTVLVAMYGATIGATSILRISACTNQACAAFRPVEKVVPEYLYYFLISKRKKFIHDGVGGAQPNISATYLKSVLFPLLPLVEQTVIVERLNRVARIIDARQRQLHALDTLIKARFVEMFGECEELVPAGTIMSEMRNGISPSTSGQHHERVLTLSAITQGRFDPNMWKDGVFDTEPPTEKRISADDFYMCRGNGNKSLVGAGVYSSEDRRDLVFPDTVIAARVDTARVCLPYLFVAWMQPDVRDQIETGARTTNGTYKINQQVISKIKIPLPPLAQQKQFAAFVSQVDKSNVVVLRALEQAQVLFDSLMQQYFG